MAKRIWQMGLVEAGICIDLNGYDPELNRNLKAALPGPARWDRDDKWWVFPLHWDTCVFARKVANEYGAKIVITPALNEWATNEKHRRETTIPDVQSMDLVDLPLVREGYPHMWEALRTRPFQTVGAAFAARNGSCLIADQPGLGKTVQSIAAVVESGVTGPVLISAPKAAALLTWPAQLRRWVPGDEIITIGSHLKPAERRQILEVIRKQQGDGSTEWASRFWVITSPNYLRITAELDDWGKYKKVNGQKVIKPVGEALMEFFDIEWAGVIVDESHQTLAGASGDKKKQSAQRLGLGALDIVDGGLRIALSGTPFRGKEEFLWGQLNWLRPDLYRSRWRWIKEWFNHEQGRYGMVIGGIANRQGMYDQAKSVMIRRTKGEVAADLPAKAYAGEPLNPDIPHEAIAVWLEMDPKQAKAYEQIKKKAEAELEGGTLMVASVLAELTRLKQFAGSYGRMDGDQFVPSLPSNKYDWTVEWLDERNIDKTVKDMDRSKREQLPKVVIASQFSSLIDVFHQALAAEGIKAYKFTGSTKQEDRLAMVEDWQENPASEYRVLLMTTKAGGTGITLDAADDLITLDDEWDVSAMEQLEDRIHRISRIHQVTIWPLRSRGTIEESIARQNFQRDNSIKMIIDGSRGVDLLRLVTGSVE